MKVSMVNSLSARLETAPAVEEGALDAAGVAAAFLAGVDEVAAGALPVGVEGAEPELAPLKSAGPGSL
jgi:hypothetical protein